MAPDPQNGDGDITSDWIGRRLARHQLDGSQAVFRSLSGRWLRNSEWRTPDGGVISIHTDVTAFKDQEDRLRASEAAAIAAKREAEQANRAKSDFLAHMSHELRTPLNAIIGFAELMGLETLGPLGNARYRAYVEDILDSGRRLLALVEDALDLSSIEAGQLKLVEEIVDLDHDIAAVVQRFAAEANHRNITLLTDVDQRLPMLIADRRSLRQMLEHLVSNALKFTPAAGSVMVTASSTPDGGLAVMVADTGAGIAEEDLARVVQPFGRTELSVGHCIDGTGLGLSIVTRLMELHNGRLDLDSAPGVGTTAILMFPAARVALPQVHTALQRVGGR